MSQQMPERIPGGGVDLSHLAARAQQPAQGSAPAGAPGGGQVVDVPAVVFDLTDATFEQAMQLSSVVPVVIDLWAEWCQPCKTLSPVLEKVTRQSAGQLVLAKVDVDANPGLAQAFQAQSIPTIVALVGGRPVPLFQGAVPEAQVREVFVQLLQLAAEQGVTGRVSAPDLDGEAQTDAAASAEPEVPEAHKPALEALERGDYAAAAAAYHDVLAKSPRDAEAKAALAQVTLLLRLQGKSADDIRAAAADRPTDVEAQLAVADLDLSGGHVEDALLRLLELFAERTDADERSAIRERLLDYFEVVGTADPRVVAARGRLASLLY